MPPVTDEDIIQNASDEQFNAFISSLGNGVVESSGMQFPEVKEQWVAANIERITGEVRAR